MRNNLEERLTELRSELSRGQQHLDSLERQRQDVRDTLLRISGAIQVLEELLQAEDATDRHVIRPQEFPEAVHPGNGNVPLEQSNTMP
jgi:hypothetical protein